MKNNSPLGLEEFMAHGAEPASGRVSVPQVMNPDPAQELSSTPIAERLQKDLNRLFEDRCRRDGVSWR